MTALRLAMVAVASVGLTAGAGELHVLRTSARDAEPTEPITITFDRPVAAQLDATVRAAAYFSIVPAVAGRAEWRDPVTLSFTPSQPLQRRTVYRVTVAAGLKAMDGSVLRAPYAFEVRPPGPRVVRAWAEDGWDGFGYLPAVPAFRIETAGRADSAAAERLIRIEFTDSGCVVAHTVGVRVRRIRPPLADTSRQARMVWHPADAEVVELAPTAPLPPGCQGTFVFPARLDELTPGDTSRAELSVRGPFALLEAGCDSPCPSGPARITFSTPVRGSEVLAHVRLEPGITFTVDTAAAATGWSLEGELKPREHYAVVVDTALRDVFGGALATVAVKAFATTPIPPTVTYEYGRLLVERRALGTLAVLHVNVDTLHVQYAAVPDSLEAGFLAEAWGGWREKWDELQKEELRIPVQSPPDKGMVTGVRVPVRARAARGGTLVAVRVTASDSSSDGPIALVQVTDLAVSARIGKDQGAVWVTGVGDGQPRAGVTVELRGSDGKVRGRGRTGADGLALLTGLRPDTTDQAVENEECEDCGWYDNAPDGYVVATLGDDRAVLGVTRYSADLSSWHFGVWEASGSGRWPMAGAVFTERGIYRPNEVVHAKAIVRAGPLGALTVPASLDSLRLVFLDRERHELQQKTMSPGRFGTGEAELRLPADAPLGDYDVRVQLRRNGSWRTVAQTSYSVAEYRPPEFLAEASAPAGPLYAGDVLKVNISARYLFGAPMGRAPVEWTLRTQRAWIWENDIPGLGEDWFVGGGGWWEDSQQGESESLLSNGTDTLDARGQLELREAIPQMSSGRPMRVTLAGTVADANQQVVTVTASALVHASEFYIAARPTSSEYILRPNTPVIAELRAVRPNGTDVAGVDVRGVAVRYEWHWVRRYHEGAVTEMGEMVTDTVAVCSARTAAKAARCTLTPKEGGSYSFIFSGTDSRGRFVRTSFSRWVTGRGYVPWRDEDKLRMEVVPDRKRYSVGDTAILLLASPLTNVEAWVTVERERVLEQRRLRITDGSTSLRIPITEAFAPNAYVSVVVVRGRSARPGPLDDPGRPTLRVGYAELRVTPEKKRLKVEVKPLKPEYRPADTARIAVHVRDGAGRGVAAEVTLWAVDEGVLALTGYQTPDPIDLIYQARGLGLRLASNLASLAPQIPEGEKGGRSPGGGGGRDVNGILRSNFRPTAFFLGSVRTNARGDAVAAGALPDNLTTFRVMAVAVTAGDRYGNGQSSLLATRPLVARPALPRFARDGDEFRAGVIVNQRAGGTPRVRVVAEATGVTLTTDRTQEATLEVGRGAAIRFGYRAQPGDSASFRFDARGAGDADAVRVSIPVRRPYHLVTHTVAGVLHDSALTEIPLPEELDPARSTLRLQVGSSPLTALRGYRELLKVYPYYCSEQVSSAATPLIALYRAQKVTGTPLLLGRPEEEIAEAVTLLSGRQTETGGIGYWSRDDWTTPWLSAYAGGVLLDARDAGFPVSDAVLAKLAGYLTNALRQPTVAENVAGYFYRAYPGLALSDQVAAADFLSRLGQPDISAENQLLGRLPEIPWEDRMRLAEVLARRGERTTAVSVITATLAGVRVDGREAVLPADAARGHYFPSQARPFARAVHALLAADPGNRLLGPLVEALVDRGRMAVLAPWNTHDAGNAAWAIASYWQREVAAGPRRVQVLDAAGRPVLELTARAQAPADTVVPLTRLLGTRPDGTRAVRLTLAARDPGALVYYDASVKEVPRAPAVRPREEGMVVERWYERVSDGKPIVSAREGELVRVRLRLTVNAERHFVVLDDALPAGLEAVDLTLRTLAGLGDAAGLSTQDRSTEWSYGTWDSGYWSPFDHRELRDDRVVYTATLLWPGTFSATYLARATTAGRFAMPPAHAEEMYNPGVNGRSGGGIFTVEAVK